MSSQRALGSTAGFAIMGSILAVVVSTPCPSSSSRSPNAADRQAVDDHRRHANPRAVAGLDRARQAAARQRHRGHGSARCRRRCIRDRHPRRDARRMPRFALELVRSSGGSCSLAAGAARPNWLTAIPEVSLPTGQTDAVLLPTASSTGEFTASSRRAAMQMRRRIVVIVFRGRDRVCRGGAVDQRTGHRPRHRPRRSSIPPPSGRSTRS